MKAKHLISMLALCVSIMAFGSCSADQNTEETGIFQSDAFAMELSGGDCIVQFHSAVFIDPVAEELEAYFIPPVIGATDRGYIVVSEQPPNGATTFHNLKQASSYGC